MSSPLLNVLYDSAYFMRMFARALDSSYWDSLEANGDGSGIESYHAFASVGERVSLATQRFEIGSYVITAVGPQKATGFVDFHRTDTAPAYTLLKGSIIRCSQSGRRFLTRNDAEFAAFGPEVVTVPIEADTPGYEWNVPGILTRANGETLPGEIDQAYILYQDPPFSEPNVTVTQPQATTGGTPGELDGRGFDRGIIRIQDEQDPAYRQRIRSLPDTVSPGAIVRLAHAILDPEGIGFYFVELWDIAYQTCWDAPSLNPGTPSYQPVAPTNPAFDTNLFSYDDTFHPAFPIKNVWLDTNEYRGAFIIQLENVAVDFVGLAYNDPGMVPQDFRNPITGNGRGTPAYNLTSLMDPTIVFGSVYDGTDLGIRAIQTHLWLQLQKIKAGGVAAIVVLGV